MGFFDDILKTAVTDEADRNSIASLSAKYPGLMKAVDDTDKAASDWEAWKANHWDPTANKTKAQVAAEQRVQQLESVQNFGGADMTFDEIKANLAKEGYVAKTDIVTALRTEKDPLNETVRGMVNGSANGIEFFFRRAGTLPVEYYNEFGKVDPELNNKLLDAYSKAPAGTDPRSLYDQIVAPEREVRRVEAKKVEDAANAAAVEKARQDGIAQGRQEAGMASGSPGMPTDQSGSGSSMGPLQRQQMDRFNSAAKETPISNAPLGSGINAREGLVWLQEQRAAGGVQ